MHRKRRRKLLEDAQFYETYRRVIELRPDFAAKRREKILVVFRKLIESGIASGEFTTVDPHEAATVLKDATILFFHPMMIKTHLDDDTETRARAVVRYVLAGFRANGATPTTPPRRRKGTPRVGADLRGRPPRFSHCPRTAACPSTHSHRTAGRPRSKVVPIRRKSRRPVCVRGERTRL